MGVRTVSRENLYGIKIKFNKRQGNENTFLFERKAGNGKIIRNEKS